MAVSPTRFELHFTQLSVETKGARPLEGRGDAFTLERMVFFPPDGSGAREAVRGKTAGAYKAVATFQWTQAVQGLALLALQTKLSAIEQPPHQRAFIDGGVRSLASSLDYALDKKPLWILDLFGVQGEGASLAQRLIRRSNAGRKRGPTVALALNQSMLPSDALRVFIDGAEVVSASGLGTLYRYVRSLDPSVAEASEGEVDVAEQPLASSDLRPAAGSSPLYFRRSPLSIRAVSFVPFFLGGSAVKGDVAGQICTDGDGKQFRLVSFDDGFAVATVEREYVCRDIPDFLLQRRQSHLAMLEEDSALTRALCERQVESTDQFVRTLPRRAAYIMSLHTVDNSADDLSSQQLLLMCEPSIVGVTDDPSEEPPVIDAAAFALSPSIDQRLREGVEVISSQTARWYASWANVMVEVLAPSVYTADPVFRLEVQLQKLWYKLFLYAHELHHGSFSAGEMRDSTRSAGEIRALLGEYLQFRRLDPVAATHIQQLKRALIKTSHIEENYLSLLAACDVLGYSSKTLQRDAGVEG